MSIGYCSDIGKVRDENQDNFCIVPQYGLFAVADGMGGHTNGRFASALALKTLTECMKSIDLTHFTLEDFEKIFTTVNTTVYQTQLQQESIMGTTLTAVVVQNQYAKIAHIGDTRLYLYRNHTLTQLTNDHSFGAERKKYASLGFSDIQKDFINDNTLTRAIGPEETIFGHYFIQELLPDDRLLLCSDGLYKMLSQEILIEILEKTIPVQQTCELLVKTALDFGGVDNITALLYQHDDRK